MTDVDATIVRAAQSGDAKAYRALFDRFRRGVMAYCLASTGGDRDRAKDLAQETFTRAFRALSSLSEPAHFRAWLFTIAANVCKTRGAVESRRRALLEAIALHQDVECDDALELERRARAVQNTLASVSDPKLRAIVELKYGEPEHTTREIAERLGIPHGTVTVKLMRFRAAIRRTLLAALAAEEEGSTWANAAS